MIPVVGRWDTREHEGKKTRGDKLSRIGGKELRGVGLGEERGERKESMIEVSVIKLGQVWRVEH